jgi:hypothetical protein
LFSFFATGLTHTSPTSGKFTAGVIDSGGKFAMVSLIPVVHHDLRISSRIFEKNRNDPNVIFRGFEEDVS